MSTVKTKTIGQEKWNVEDLAGYIGLPVEKVRKQDNVVLEAMINQQKQLAATQAAKEQAEKKAKTQNAKKEKTKTVPTQEAKALGKALQQDLSTSKDGQVIQNLLNGLIGRSAKEVCKEAGVENSYSLDINISKKVIAYLYQNRLLSQDMEIRLENELNHTTTSK